MAEREPSKLGVAGSSPVSRSISVLGPADAQVAQSVEHVLGKDEVSGSIPLLGLFAPATRRGFVNSKMGKDN